MKAVGKMTECALNPYCEMHARRVLNKLGVFDVPRCSSDAALVQEVALELARFYRLGRTAVISRVEKAVAAADKVEAPGWATVASRRVK